jgi:Holliday junction resolvase RusA-like endonuclease
LIENVLDLPYPPSVNKIWRKAAFGVGMTSAPEYVNWKAQSDKLVMMLGQLRGRPTIAGSFEARIVVDATKKRGAQRGDLDNKIKACLDAAQRYELIADDKNCERLTIEWGDAPHGCRLILRELAVA